MARYVYGPSLDGATETGDASLKLRGVRPGGFVDLTLEEGDPAFTTRPTGVFACYLDGPPGDLTPEQALNSTPRVGAASAEDLAKGGDFTVTVAGVKPGKYFVQTVLEFAA